MDLHKIWKKFAKKIFNDWNNAPNYAAIKASIQMNQKVLELLIPGETTTQFNDGL